MFSTTYQSCFDRYHVLGSIERAGEVLDMYRCYGNYNVAIVKSERG